MNKPTGLTYENGVLVKYTSYGRKRKNWKQDYRERSRNKLKHIKHCQLCGSTENLTIHHKTPLCKKVDISRENLIKVCRICHDKVERGEVQITTQEFILIDEKNVAKFADALKGYGLIISVDNQDVVIKIPQGRGFYEEVVGPIPIELNNTEEQINEVHEEQIPHGV